MNIRSRGSVLMLVAAALLQAGCATMSQDQCLDGDWAMIGYTDGTDGRPPSYLDNHAKACAAYGVSPDPATYFEARDRGLFEYCTPPRGFHEGRMDRKYYGVCPPQVADGFLAGYQDGLRVHAAEEHRDEIRRDVNRFERRIDDIGDELDEIADRLDDPGLGKGTRKALEDSRRDLRRELRSVEAHHRRAWNQEQAAEDHATRLRLDMTRYYGSW